MSTATDFWSRRKASVRAEAESERIALEAEYQKASREALEAKSDEEILAELNLPDPDELKAGDDFSAFMARTIPERLRRRALRKLWLSNPVLANVDGLVDYGEDYTDAANVVENLQTSYMVGRGMLSHVKEMAKFEDTPAGDDADAAQHVSADVADTAETDEADPAATEIGASGVEDRESIGKPAQPSPARTVRRMRFAVDDGLAGNKTAEAERA